MSVLAKHETTPAVDTVAAARWPQDTLVSRGDHGPTLVMFAHPRCPCTRASLTELENVLAQQPGNVAAWVLFMLPADADDQWMDTDQVASAKSIPGVNVLCDVDGVEAKRFNVATSGHTLLYDGHGDLVFSGGITMSRGHLGNNAGRSSVERILNGQQPIALNAPVFGCSIQQCK
jgi:hypothetical protein